MPYLHYFDGRTCPHCHAIAQQQLLHAAPMHIKTRTIEGKDRYEPEGKRFRCLTHCTNCKQPQMMEIEWKKAPADGSNEKAHWLADGFLNRLYTADVLNKGGGPNRQAMAIMRGSEYGAELSNAFRVIATYPETALQRPEQDDVPEDIHKEFDELDGVRSRPRFAAIACRRILELATSHRLENPKERLADRLGQLEGQGLITREVRDWMKQLKTILNDATHGGADVTSEQAEELIRFTNVVIELLFTYPARIAKYKRDDE